MKILVACLCVLLAVLQWRLWFGEGSLQQVSRLQEEARAARAEVLRLQTRDRALAAEVRDLKSGLEAIEERARTDLGMVAEDETFFRFVGAAPADGARRPFGALPGSERASDAPLPDSDGEIEVLGTAGDEAPGEPRGLVGSDGSYGLDGPGTIRREPRAE